MKYEAIHLTILSLKLGFIFSKYFHILVGGKKILLHYAHFLGRKAMRNLYSILKSKDITLLTKDRIVKVMVFPVVMYVCES